MCARRAVASAATCNGWRGPSRGIRARLNAVEPALAHAVVLEEIGVDQVRWLVLGHDPSARFLELVVLDRPRVRA